MARNVVKLDGQRLNSTPGVDGKTTLTLRVRHRTAWGARMYAQGRQVDLSSLIEPLVEELIRGKRIPWHWFNELTAPEAIDSPRIDPGATPEDTAGAEVLSTAPIGETLPTIEPVEAGAPEGRGEKGRKRAEDVMERIRRRKAG